MRNPIEFNDSGKIISGGSIKSDNVYDIGRCRKNAPTIKGWPAVFVNDWCGDHKIDEEKI